MQYNAYVSMQTQELLPSPYDTHCLDFLELWKKNNGTGPLNHLQCVEFCQLNKLVEQGKCIDKNVDYPHNIQLCRKNYQSLTSDIVKNCTLECRDACHAWKMMSGAIQSVEMFSYIGGLFSIHVAGAVFIVFDLFETICYLFLPHLTDEGQNGADFG
ncbi:uncharacterized protein CEXT_527651 [Caerostris extrusa]|uniref:Uncharacterized protein n=1 Tax=Caerostris extrusa TaxID=172846 RepID=A0AAV4NLZ8_CAEEX|nr:uncharacterized protein CEXT_527651 [Caerostris extrusa]